MYSSSPMNKTRIKPVLLFHVGSTIELSIFLIPAFAFILCVYLSPCVSLSPDIPLSFLGFLFVCLFLLCSSVEPAVRVCCTWLTCSRRAGCQQKPHHFASPLSALHRCQEDCLSTSKNTHWMHSWVIRNWSCVVFCVHERPFVPRL